VKTASPTDRMLRDVDCKQVVFIAAGVPALVLFSTGGSATIGAPACWSGRFQFYLVLPRLSRTQKARPAPVKDGRHGRSWATAWIRYSSIRARLSLWSNSLAGTPVLAIGAGLGAGSLLNC
jgi:hypothetical protein